MATVKHVLLPDEAIFLAASFPQLVKNNGTSAPVSGLAFDASAAENAFWKFIAENYGASNPNLTLNVFWYADTATSGDVVFSAAIGAITPNTDTQDIETKALATATSVTDSHLGTTGQRLHQCAITISNLDSITADDFAFLKFFRDAANGSDTMTGDAIVVMLELTYSDT